MDRRDFLKKSAVLAALGSVAKLVPSLNAAPVPASPAADGPVDIAVVRNGEVTEMFETLM